MRAERKKRLWDNVSRSTQERPTQGSNSPNIQHLVVVESRAKTQQLVFDFIDLQETGRPGRTLISAAGCGVVFRGQEEAEVIQLLHGVGLAVNESICRRSVHTHQLNDERLISMRASATV